MTNVSHKNDCLHLHIRSYWIWQYAAIAFPSFSQFIFRFCGFFVRIFWFLFALILGKTITRHAYASYDLLGRSVRVCVPPISWLSANNSIEHSRPYCGDFLRLSQTLPIFKLIRWNLNENNYFDEPKMKLFQQWIFLTFQFTLAVLRFVVFSIQRRQTLLLLLRSTHTHTHMETRAHSWFMFSGQNAISVQWRNVIVAPLTRTKEKYVFTLKRREISPIAMSSEFGNILQFVEKWSLCVATILNSPYHWISCEIVIALASEWVAIDSHWKC